MPDSGILPSGEGRPDRATNGRRTCRSRKGRCVAARLSARKCVRSPVFHGENSRDDRKDGLYCRDRDHGSSLRWVSSPGPCSPEDRSWLLTPLLTRTAIRSKRTRPRHRHSRKLSNSHNDQTEVASGLRPSRRRPCDWRTTAGPSRRLEKTINPPALHHPGRGLETQQAGVRPQPATPPSQPIRLRFARLWPGGEPGTVRDSKHCSRRRCKILRPSALCRLRRARSPSRLKRPRVWSWRAPRNPRSTRAGLRRT